MYGTEVYMSQIALRDTLLMELVEYATEQSVTPEQIIDKLVSQFLYQMSLKKMEAETEAFQEMHDVLVSNYFGEYVAIHNRRLVDNDSDLGALRKRIRDKYGKMAILLRQVTENAKTPIFRMRSPKQVTFLPSLSTQE